MRVRPPTPALSADSLDPGLYLVATPIGNLRDITLRALDVLANADLVIAEDTRVSGRLLSIYDISTRIERYDDHTDERARPGLLKRLNEGARIALVSDAGTPLISDPGYRLVAAAVAQGSAVFPVPGPSAVLAALTVSGLPTDRFLFVGFLPPKTTGRQSALLGLVDIRASLVFYETGPRLRDCLKDLAHVLGNRPALVAREITKLHETKVYGTLASLAADPALDGPKGEIVIVVGAPHDSDLKITTDDLVDVALIEALTRLAPAAAATEVAATSGRPRRELYRRALDLKGS
jgi:16S rRNA (cytidine1402-2'-O)-methyltransferase